MTKRVRAYMGKPSRYSNISQRKHRTHSAKSDGALAPRGSTNATPKTFVVKSGHVSGPIGALVTDMRRLLEPNTARRLKIAQERKRNRLKDYVAMSAPLGVSHILVFSQSSTSTDTALSNTNMRISRMPRGPTLTFKILRYALCRDILSASRRPHSPGREHTTEPLLIMNNFGGDERQVKLMMTFFQNLLPAIHVHTMPLTAARRVVLLSYNSETRTVDLRHYLISVRSVGVSKPVRKIIEGSSHSRSASVASSKSGLKGIPDLSQASDIAEYVLHHSELGYASSASEAESDADGSAPRNVELQGNYMGRANRKAGQGEQRAIKLVELGPRLELGLVKIEDGIGSNEGEIVFHELVSKSPAEVASLDQRQRERLLRRKTQEARVRAKLTSQRDKDQIETQHSTSQEGEDWQERQPDAFAYEDLFDDAVDEGTAGNILDEVLAESSGEATSQSAMPHRRERSRDPRRPKFTLKR